MIINYLIKFGDHSHFKIFNLLLLQKIIKKMVCIFKK